MKLKHHNKNEINNNKNCKCYKLQKAQSFPYAPYPELHGIFGINIIVLLLFPFSLKLFKETLDRYRLSVTAEVFEGEIQIVSAQQW